MFYIMSSVLLRLNNWIEFEIERNFFIELILPLIMKSMEIYAKKKIGGEWIKISTWKMFRNETAHSPQNSFHIMTVCSFLFQISKFTHLYCARSFEFEGANEFWIWKWTEENQTDLVLPSVKKNWEERLFFSRSFTKSEANFWIEIVMLLKAFRYCFDFQVEFRPRSFENFIISELIFWWWRGSIQQLNNFFYFFAFFYVAIL